MTRQKKRKRRRGTQSVLGLIIIITSIYFFLHTSIFNISTITVQDNTFLSKEQILGVAAINQGENIWQLNEVAVRERIRLLPQIKSVAIKRKLPDAIIISIKERIPIAVVVADGQALKLDRFGVNLGSGELNGILPIITGVELKTTPAPGEEAKGENLFLALEVARWLVDLKADFVAEIDVSETPMIKVYTEQGIEIRLGDEEKLEEKITAAKIIISEVSKKQTIDYIDVSYRPVVKVK